MSIYQRGSRGCMACESAKQNQPIQRWKDNDGKWRYYRSCTWCGCCYPITAYQPKRPGSHTDRGTTPAALVRDDGSPILPRRIWKQEH